MTQDDRRFFVHRASRTEQLAQTLISSIAAALPANPLQAQTIVVAHVGLRRWLLGEFARRNGIAANFDMILPWQWLQRTAAVLLGDQALIDGDYGEDSLRWHIFRALPAIQAPELAAYLAVDDGGRQRFRLAGHLATVFTQCLVYRATLMLAWERGEDSGDWRARLWREVVGSVGGRHRAQRCHALVSALVSRGDGAELPLHVFGVSHLAPDVLAALHALALHREVHLYFPDPCREHWSYLRRERTLLETPDPESLYFEVGHPLLASLGRMGQEFCLALEDLDVHDVDDPGDAHDDGAERLHLLGALQTSIRRLRPQILAAGKADREDASLRVHACHTRMRELEVLKDALLGFLAADPTLQARDIVVMAPDIGAYAAHIPAVFGEAARYTGNASHIPWHIADVRLALTHPLLGAFSNLLELAESRFRVSDVLGFLDTPAVARRFGIDEGTRANIENLVRRAGVAWGLDAEMKAAAGAAPLVASSWQFGMDRLYAGLVIGDDRPHEEFDGVVPVAGVAGSAAETLGCLDALLETLRRLRAEFARARPLDAWCQWLIDAVDGLFAADRRDFAEVEALDALRRMLARLGTQADAAGRDTALAWGVAREAVRAALATISERQPFLLGGVTFCGLVPQRSIPFRVVCLLGMNEGEFPRPSSDAGLNPVAAKPRRGDRDTRNEDRYLFLEALMAARERLHISFLGEGVNDGKPRNPSSVLAELLQFLDGQLPAGERSWLVRHPLQPYDPRYFRGAGAGTSADARLFSYDRAFADFPRTPLPAVAFDDAKPGTRPVASCADTTVSLASFKRFWKDPSKVFLRDELSVGLEALDDETWPDTEALEAKTDRRERVGRRLVLDALASGVVELPARPPSWLKGSGLLAPGAVGERAYAELRASAQAALKMARTVLPATLRRSTQLVNVDLGDGLRLYGGVEVRVGAEGPAWLFDAKPQGAAGFRELLSLYIDWAALRLGSAADVDLLFVEKDKDEVRPPPLLQAIAVQDQDQLRRGLRRLAEAALRARGDPILFMPMSAWAWLHAEEAVRREAARKRWRGGKDDERGERDYAPGYAALLTRGRDPIDSSDGYAQFVAAAELVADVLDPGRRVLGGANAENGA